MGLLLYHMVNQLVEAPLNVKLFLHDKRSTIVSVVGFNNINILIEISISIQNNEQLENKDSKPPTSQFGNKDEFWFFLLRPFDNLLGYDKRMFSGKNEKKNSYKYCDT